MKRTALLVSIALILVSLTVPVSAESYWTVREDYLKAVEAHDDRAIISSVKRLEAVYSMPSEREHFDRLATPLEQAGAAYERLGYYDDAVKYYNRSYRCYKWINDNEGVNYRDKLRGLEALTDILSGHFGVYTESGDPTEYPRYGALNEPETGTVYGFCDEAQAIRTAKLIYVQYFDNDIKDFSWMLPTEDSVDTIEIAWNVSPETLGSLKKVAAKENEDYLTRNVEYLASLDYKVLLRFGAEVNCWSDLVNHTKEENTSAFKAAFRKIADKVHATAPNVAMVFSPNDVSNWEYSPEDFYPGDRYVDWVGMSAYCNKNNSSDFEVGNQSDAWYHIGNYENPVEQIRKIVESFGDRKPIMVSECGFCYSSTNSVQTEEHALAALKYFYSYVNMVYPQVKAVFYFNTDFGGNCYKLKGNILAAYNEVTSDNAGMRATFSDDKRVYVPFDSLNEKTDSLPIYTYTSLPGKNAVTYKLDGKKVFSSAQAPYKYTVRDIAEGLHTLTVILSNANTEKSEKYMIYADSEGRVSTTVSKMKDVKPSAWYATPVAYCIHNSIFKGMTDTTFAPDVTMTRAMLVTTLYRISGEGDYADRTTAFVDVGKKKYYRDAVIWASENGIVKGIDKTHFAPDATVTREQVATILYRYCEYAGYGDEISGKKSSLESHPDYGDVSSYAKSAMSWAKYSEIIQGDEKGRLKPQGGATRAQIAKMLYVYLQKYPLKTK